MKSNFFKFMALGVFFGVMIVANSGCGSSTSATGGDGGSDTRDFSGSLGQTSIPAPALMKNQSTDDTIACTELSICCGAYDGSLMVVAVAADCYFTLSLPLNNFCYCSVFTGDDEDANSCPDTWVASMGCSEEGYSGSVPGLPGCWSQGATEQEAMENIKDAIREYLAVVDERLRGEDVREIEVAV